MTGICQVYVRYMSWSQKWYIPGNIPDIWQVWQLNNTWYMTDIWHVFWIWLPTARGRNALEMLWQTGLDCKGVYCSAHNAAVPLGIRDSDSVGPGQTRIRKPSCSRVRTAADEGGSVDKSSCLIKMPRSIEWCRKPIFSASTRLWVIELDAWRVLLKNLPRIQYNILSQWVVPFKGATTKWI